MSLHGFGSVESLLKLKYRIFRITLKGLKEDSVKSILDRKYKVDGQ